MLHEFFEVLAVCVSAAQIRKVSEINEHELLRAFRLDYWRSSTTQGTPDIAEYGSYAKIAVILSFG